MPLGFITGVYGMNFNTARSPWNMPELNWRYGYPFALTLMALTLVAMFWYFHHKGWLGDGKP
jgi:magnesium transporter